MRSRHFCIILYLVHRKQVPGTDWKNFSRAVFGPGRTLSAKLEKIPKNSSKSSKPLIYLRVWGLKPFKVTSERVTVPRKRKDMCCLQPSSAGCRAWGSGWACGSRGRSGHAGSRCPSWSTGPSHPGRHYHNGRHMPAAQTLSTHSGRVVSI